MSERSFEALVIGAAIVDMLLCPVPKDVFALGSVPVDTMRMSFGGDALNESVHLNRFGHSVQLITELGNDTAGEMVRAYCARENVPLYAREKEGLATGINTVLITPDGERSFVTDPHGSLRSLSIDTLRPLFETRAWSEARLISYASMFVSSRMSIKDTEELFARAKKDGKLVCTDMTKRKKGETLADVAHALSFCDYVFPNLDEARLLTGLSSPEEIAKAFLDIGVGHAVLKLGRDGCLVADRNRAFIMPACTVRCVDTTGAGDTFTAGFIASILEGRSHEACAAFANAAASFTVGEVGAATACPTRTEIEARAVTLLKAGITEVSL